jgi:carboxyl-terminal processing protease
MYNIGNKNMLSKVIVIMQVIFLLLGANTVLAKIDTKDKEEKHPDSYYFRQFQEVFQRIEKDYMQEPERQEMTDEAINGMLRSLDPYS